MITFSFKDDKILLHYTPEREENWIKEAIDRRPYITIKKTFTFWKELLIVEKENNNNEENEFPDFDEFETTTFLFAILNGEYFKLIRGIVVDKFDIYFHKSLPIAAEYFVVDSNVSVFKVIGNIYKGDVYVGGEKQESLSGEAFDNLLKLFPTAYERKKYIEARVASVFRNYFDNVKDAEKTYQKYVDKRLSTQGNNLSKTFQEYEIAKYNIILDKLKAMLLHEIDYSEHQWQEEILQIVLLLYPKYIFVFREVPV